MATKRKWENPEDAELEAVRTKIRQLEGTLQSLKDRELQLLKNDLVDNKDQEAQVEGHKEVIDFLSVFVNNQGFKRIADKIFTFLDCCSFVNCRSVCRSWKNYIDNEWSTLQLQIFHMTKYPNKIRPGFDDDEPYSHLLNEAWFNDFNFAPLIEVMKKTKDKSDLRLFVNMCREFVPMQNNPTGNERGIMQYLIDLDRHRELKFILDCSGVSPNPAVNYAWDFRYACQYGCELCVKLFLDRSEERQIDLNVGLFTDWLRNIKIIPRQIERGSK